MKNKTQEQCYSIDGERFYSYKELMRRLLESYNKGEEVEVFEADKKEYSHLDFINDYGVIEDMQCMAMDECEMFGYKTAESLTNAHQRGNIPKPDKSVHCNMRQNSNKTNFWTLGTIRKWGNE